jgi:hypothetical protein
LTLADVLSNNYIHTTLFSPEKLKCDILRSAKLKVKFEALESITVLNVLL